MQLERFFHYLEYEKRYSPHTCLSYKTDLKQFHTFLEIQYELDDWLAVQSKHIRSWVVQLLQQKYAPGSIHRKASSLKAFYNFLLLQEVVKQHPFKGVHLPKKPQQLPKFIEETRIQLLFEELEFSKDFAGQRDLLLLDLLYSTGMRRNELIQLSWQDVDWSNNSLRILGKGQKMRIIPLLPSLQAHLREYEKVLQEVFPKLEHAKVMVTDKGKPLYPKFVYNKVKHYLSAVTTAEGRSPHVLRHSFATHLANQGAKLNAIKELLGHASLASTQIYTHSSIEELKKAYQKAHPKAKKKD